MSDLLIPVMLLVAIVSSFLGGDGLVIFAAFIGAYAVGAGVWAAME